MRDSGSPRHSRGRPEENNSDFGSGHEDYPYPAPSPSPPGFTRLPPNLAARIRRGSIVMGAALLLGGIVLLTSSVTIVVVQASLHEPARLGSVGVSGLPGLVLICVAISMFRIRGCVREGYLDLARAHQVSIVLRLWWIIGLLAGLFVIVFILVVDMASAKPATLSLITVAIMVAVVGTTMCNLGYFTGKGMLYPKLSR